MARIAAQVTSKGASTAHNKIPYKNALNIQLIGLTFGKAI